MSFALGAGVTGLQAHQKMLDVAGNNLANMNSTAYKAKNITFAELLSQTQRSATQPTGTVGGTNPHQMGTGVGIANINANMTQGDIDSTGNPLDMAIEGEGYFVLSDGQQNVFTRAGEFGVDSASNLVDPATGYKVQRIGSTGEEDNFQVPGDSNIRIPYDAAMPAKATESIRLAGNLSADNVLSTTQTQMLDSAVSYSFDGSTADGSSRIDDLDQFTGGQLGAGQSGIISIAGITRDGQSLSDYIIDRDGNDNALSFEIDENGQTLNDFIDHLNNDVFDGIATAELVNGRIRVTDSQSGYSKLDMDFSYSGDGNLQTPSYFEMTTVGGDEVQNINITTYDSQGSKQVLAGSFVRTNTENVWDLVLTSITGNVQNIDMSDRRIEQINFDSHNGAFMGVEGDNDEFTITFGHDTDNPQRISLDMGTAGHLDGLTQFAGDSTAVAREQDGYEAGSLSTVSVSNEGIIIGAFSNGIRKDIAAVQIAQFQNPAGLESVGDGYFLSSANSGEPVATQAMAGGAGTIHGSSLEKSNADVASEFVNMIQAQNGFQANARTIRVANDVLTELTNLIR